jgi:hypothetical protein
LLALTVATSLTAAFVRSTFTQLLYSSSLALALLVMVAFAGVVAWRFRRLLRSLPVSVGGNVHDTARLMFVSVGGGVVVLFLGAVLLSLNTVLYKTPSGYLGYHFASRTLEGIAVFFFLRFLLLPRLRQAKQVSNPASAQGASSNANNVAEAALLVSQNSPTDDPERVPDGIRAAEIELNTGSQQQASVDSNELS